MWWDRVPSETPYRPEPNEQQSGQYTNSLPELPHEYPYSDRDLGQGQIVGAEAMYDLQRDIPATEIKGQTVQEPQLSERTGQTISRTAVGVINRVDRLTAIGNGQVPAVVREVWRLLGPKPVKNDTL